MLPDFGLFFQTILEQGCPAGVTVAQDVNADSYAEVPVVFWQASVGGQRDAGLWSVQLFLTVVTDTDAYQLLAALYELIQSWNMPGRGVYDRIGVVSVEDGEVFNPVFEDIFLNGKHLSQFMGEFRVTVRDYR